MHKEFNNVISRVTNWWHDDKQLRVLRKFGIIDNHSLEKLHEAIKIVDEVYSGKWDLRVYSSWDYFSHKLRNSIAFIIYFPEVTITNSRKEHHTIHDLYVMFDIIYNSYFSIGSIQGMRTTFSFAEYQSKYSHSHLPSVDFKKYPPHFTGFCTGSGVINQVAMMFNAEMSEGKFDENLFKMYLFEIKQYIGWESLEGGPFQYMSGVRLKGDNHSLKHVSGETVKSYMSALKNKLPTLDYSSLTIDLDTNNNIHIVDNDAFEEFVLSTVDRNTSIIYCSKDDEGNYVQIEENSNIKQDYSREKVHFQGKEIGYDIDINLVSNPQKIYANPIIKKVCKSILEYEYNKEQIKAFSFR